MRRTVRTALLAALIAPAIASAASAGTFTANGETYDYTAARAANGTVLINGHVQSDGTAFALRVHGRDVQGRMGASEVAFTVSRETLAKLNSEMASAGGTPTAVAAN